MASDLDVLTLTSLAFEYHIKMDVKKSEALTVVGSLRNVAAVLDVTYMLILTSTVYLHIHC